MRRLVTVILAAILVCACTDTRRQATLDRAARLMDTRPDSSLLLLDSLLPASQRSSSADRLSDWPRRDRMRWLLLRTNAENKLDTVFRTDTLFRPVVDWYDRHGTPNERMLAHYLLGRIYSDMGEAPAALQAFHDAADCADTTATDCDFHQLMIIHGQMAELYNSQWLPRDMLRELRIAYRYALQAGDTVTAIISIEREAVAYNVLHLPDSEVATVEKACSLFREKGMIQDAAIATQSLIMPYLEKDSLAKAKKCIDYFEEKSGLVDSSGNVVAGKELYYYEKGTYCLKTGKLDTAEELFRKTLATAKTPNEKEAGNYGLFLMYKQSGQRDSSTKYAERSYAVNNQRDLEVSSNEVRHVSALYNYARHQNLARVEESKAARAKLMLTNAIAVIILLLVAIALVFRHYHVKRKAVYRDYKAKLHELTKIQSDQMRLQAEQYDKLSEEKNLVIARLAEELKGYRQHRKTISQSDVEELIKVSPICNRFHELATSTREAVSQGEWEQLMDFFNEKLPGFYSSVNEGHAHLRHDEYRLCMLVRLHFAPYEICSLMGESSSNVANMRSRLHMKVFGEKGSSKEFDHKIQYFC